MIDLLSRWFHILPACILVGGSWFLFFAYSPGIAQISDAARAEVVGAVRRRWALWVGIASGLILITGLYNVAMNEMRYDLTPIYRGLVAVKLLLAFALMFLASLLSGRTALAERLQQKRLWSGVAALLATILVLAGGLMRNEPKAPKVRTPIEVVEPVADEAGVSSAAAAG